MLKALVFTAALSLLAGAPALAADADRSSGVWVLDAAQSPEGSSKQTLTITVRDDEETYFSEWVAADGTRGLTGFVVRYNAAPVPTKAFTIAPDGSISAKPIDVVVRRLDDRRRVVEHQQGGKVVRELRRTMTPDRRTMVSELTDFDAAGAKIRAARLVFVRR